ncbi:MAG: ComEC family competence protein [Flavipsychrobacter sp.]|nr:ComEC family competence protein [Flavipsychrobacter sp.]
MKRWPLHTTNFWETAPFFRILLPFAAGIFCYDQMQPAKAEGIYFIVLALLSLLVFGVLSIAKSDKSIYGGIVFAALQLCLFFSGLSISHFGDVRNNKWWYGKGVNEGNTYLARITDAPARKDHSWKLPIAVVNVIKDGKISTVTGNAFLYLYKDMQPMLLHKGDTILVPDKWQAIHNSGNPFEFDYATYCRRNNILFSQSCSIKNIRLYATNDEDNAPIAERVHDWCMHELDTYIADTVAKGLIQAMLLGDEVNLDEDLRQSYSETGIIHIIAISGGNVIIFFTVISALLWWLKNKRHLWVKYAIALPLVWFYVMMAGAPPSAVRAAIMFSLLAFSVMLQKNNSSLNTLFATGFVLLFAQPMWLFSVGFQLSFVAVLSLILFYAPIYKCASPKHIVTRKLWGAVAASIAAEVLVAPLVIYYFHTFPLLFIVANVAAFLFMEVVLVLSMVVIAASVVPALASITGAVIVWLVTLFDHIVKWLQGFSPASFHFLMITGVELFIIYVVITGLSLFLIRKKKQALFTGIIACCVLLISFCNDEWIRLQQDRLVVYNTGKTNHVELIRGARFSVLHTDTAVTKQVAYAVNPAHINWRVWRKDSNYVNEFFEVGGKTVLVLNEAIPAESKFPVDYLIVNYTCKLNAMQLKNIFSPKMTVIGNNYSKRMQEDLVKSFTVNGMSVHSIANDGAFILP